MLFWLTEFSDGGDFFNLFRYITFRAGGPCARCSMTTVDQATGAFEGPEPLRTLATYRRDATEPTHVNFGQNLIPETKSATLRVGDTVTFP